MQKPIALYMFLDRWFLELWVPTKIVFNFPSDTNGNALHTLAARHLPVKARLGDISFLRPDQLRAEQRQATSRGVAPRPQAAVNRAVAAKCSLDSAQYR